ncbi:hypothetical protein PVAP13_3KG124755 [Panicum virgatum]|uniref:Uncharacterized protein n=1 Tax=Panicum virgatum TaxID=38727 RepID=A0A8T0V1J3_PANVG|nr:hypothetical protein PVAP13_3KG124755 [Panicum virgatum]
MRNFQIKNFILFLFVLENPKVGDQMDHISDWANISSFKETSERNWILEFSGQSALTDTTGDIL